MKLQLGRCLLRDRMEERSVTADGLAQALLYKPERLKDYADNKRIMPLQVAISIADTLGCDVRELYELSPAESARSSR